MGGELLPMVRFADLDSQSPPPLQLQLGGGVYREGIDGGGEDRAALP